MPIGLPTVQAGSPVGGGPVHPWRPGEVGRRS
jgi:hypothetical protein